MEKREVVDQLAVTTRIAGAFIHKTEPVVATMAAASVLTVHGNDRDVSPG